MFLFGAIFAIVTIAFFLFGGLSQRAICDTLQYPEDSNIIGVVDKLINLKEYKISTNIATIIKQCHKNESIYNVLGLKELFDLSELENFVERYKIEDILNDMKGKITFNQTIQFLTANELDKLETLMDSGISDINYDKFIEEVCILYLL